MSIDGASSRDTFFMMSHHCTRAAYLTVLAKGDGHPGSLLAIGSECQCVMYMCMNRISGVARRLADACKCVFSPFLLHTTMCRVSFSHVRESADRVRTQRSDRNAIGRISSSPYYLSLLPTLTTSPYYLGSAVLELWFSSSGGVCVCVRACVR